ncbi:MAG: IS200/IS605 family element transposase accessory protein TnpB [Candidatus Methanomethyliales bacterium]|nr:IS200/IS605 family element transposase accessory protein TnpB [Candidatus Methanomethylicales archaeon]
MKKAVELVDEPETVIAIDRGERNLAVAVAISKNNPDKPLKGQFWRGEEIKRIRGLYSHIRRRLQEKNRIGKIKELRGREERKVTQQLHIIANEIIAYTKQFPKPVIVMENLNGIRNNFKNSKKINKRFHSLPFRRLQTIIECKALLEGIEVKYLTRKETENTSKKCPKCGLTYYRDLNAAINIAHALTRGMGWGSCSSEPPEPAYVAGTQRRKGRLNAGSSRL